LAKIPLAPFTLKQGAPEAGHGGRVVDPKATAVAPLKPLPLIWTPVPPAAVPWLGISASTTGKDVAYAGVAIPITAPTMKTGRSVRAPGFRIERAR
jgi:hypothetical protein